jgi:hypothetical protein
METGNRAFPSDSIPHSKLFSLFFDLIRGDKMCVKNNVNTTKPPATTN